MNPRAQFKRLMDSPGIIAAVGAGDAGHAKLIEDAGFPAVYISGSFVSFTFGWPDVGLITMREMVDRASSIVNRVNIPVIADADEGYGGVINVMSTVREYERSGVAAIHLEDMFTKKYGVMAPITSAADHIKAALEARMDPGLNIIARTDALAPWRTDLETEKREDDCMKRCLAYVDAGADIIMIQVGPTSAETLNTFCREVPRPIMVTMGAWGLNPPVDELEQIGVKIVVYPILLRHRMVPIMRAALRELREEGRAVYTDEERREWDYVNTKVLGLDELKKVQAKYPE